MTDIMAAIGLAQLERYPAMLERRRQLIGRYDEALAGRGVQVLDHYGADHASSGHLYLVRLLGRDVAERNDAIVRMAERGIACNVHYKPLPMMTAYKALGFDIARLSQRLRPVSQRGDASAAHVPFGRGRSVCDLEFRGCDLLTRAFR